MPTTAQTSRLGPITDRDILLVQQQRARQIDGGGCWQSWTRILFTLQDVQREQQERGE